MNTHEVARAAHLEDRNRALAEEVGRLRYYTAALLKVIDHSDVELDHFDAVSVEQARAALR